MSAPRPSRRLAFFATCPPGVEPILKAEAKELRLARVESQVGGVYFEGEMRDAWRANLWLRTAVRVLLRVARFDCPDEKALYTGAREVDWSRFLASDGRLVVDAHTRLSALDHTRFIEQRVKDAVVDQFRERAGARPTVDRLQADLGIHVHLFRDRCTLLADTSGGALHRRGWRREPGPAPLSETLAAAVVLLSGWDRRAPLLDPFCGSGTIPIEAALLAGHVAPGLLRERFGFERWQDHDPAGWTHERERARAEESFRSKLVVRGTDVDPACLAAARANVRAAGLEERVQLERADARDFAPRPGWNAFVVTNLPYGKRVGAGGSSRGGDSLEALYRDFGRVLHERCAGYRVALFAPDDPRTQALGLAGAESLPLMNGGLDCRLLRATIEG